MNTEAQYTTESSSANFCSFPQPDRKAGVCSKQCREFVSIPNPCFQSKSKKEKTECNCCLLFKSQGEILCGLSFFFLPIVLGVCYCQHVLCHKGLVFLTEIDHPYLSAAAVLQVVSSHRTTCSCFQTPLWNSISFPQLNSLLCFCKSFRHSFPVSCQFPEMVLTWWKSLTPQGYSTLAHVGC